MKTRVLIHGLCIGLMALLGLGAASAPASLSVAAPSAVVQAAVTPTPHPILSDFRVRRAIAYCTDKDAIIAAAYPDLTNPSDRQALVMDSFIPQGNWAYTVPTTTYAYSPTVGEGLLDTAGWTLGGGPYRTNAQGKELVLSLTTTTASFRATYLAVFIAQMQACGIDVLFNPQPGGWLFGTNTAVAVRDFEMVDFAWGTSADPGPLASSLFGCDRIPSPANRWSGQNATGWCNATVAATLPLANNTQVSQSARRAYYAVIVDEFMKDVPTLGLFMRTGSTPDSATWEHIDLNLETYTQAADVTAGAGGVLNYTDFSGNQGSADVPAGAVTQTVELAYTPLVAPGNTLPDNQGAALTFRLTALEDGVPQSTFVFSQPVTLTVPYGPADLAGIFDANSLNLIYWDGAAWQDASTTCSSDPYKHLDTAARVFTVRVCHLSEFSLSGTANHPVYVPLMRR